MITFYNLFSIYIKDEYQWNKTAKYSLSNDTDTILYKYTELYPRMKMNPLFLYNYGAELNKYKHWNKSAAILEECSSILNDVDVQLLLADCYLKQDAYEDSKRCLTLASNMCPSRFLPKYYLFKIYEKTGNVDSAKLIAEKLAIQRIKIPSEMISYIKAEVSFYLKHSEYVINEHSK